GARVVSPACGQRDLLSFPTRRSSDLRRLRYLARARAASTRVVCPAVCPRGRRRKSGRCGPAIREGAAGSAARPRAIHPPGRAPRSEEHTSELQSREKLVCRLLLEKKN